MGRIDLSGKTLDSTYTPATDGVVMRKKVAIDAIKVTPIPVNVVASSDTPAPTSHRRASTPTPTTPPPTTPETQAPPGGRER